MDLQANYRRFQEKHAEVIALAVQGVDRAQLTRDITQAAFPILADSEHKTADAYGVYNLMGDGVAAPSVFIVDLAGDVIWSYIGRDASDRPTVDTVLSYLAPVPAFSSIGPKHMAARFVAEPIVNICYQLRGDL